MIINITKSKMFKIDPDMRFAEEYVLPKGAWIELYRRYKLLGYSYEDLCDYFFIKYARRINSTSLNRWIVRSRIYEITAPLIKSGVEHVNTEIFDDLEDYVMNELVKTVKTGSSSNSKSII